MVCLSNSTIRAEALADPSYAGGTITDNDLDFQVASTFTGLAVSSIIPLQRGHPLAILIILLYQKRAPAFRRGQFNLSGLRWVIHKA
jgi:hypothetical protein